MQSDIKAVETQNRDFYDAAYSSAFSWRVIIKFFLSYDQLSKTKRNLAAIRQLIHHRNAISFLDYGFGYGTLLLRLPKGVRLFGCELSSAAINNLKQLSRLFNRQVTLLLPEQLANELEPASLDVISCSHVIEHVANDVEFLKLFHNLLNADGHLLLNVPINEVWDDPNHVRKYTAQSIADLLLEVGFKIEKVITSDRWSAYLLHQEKAWLRNGHPFHRIGRVYFQCIRLLFAVTPIRVLDRMEWLLAEAHLPQQMIVLAQKK